MKPFAYKKPPVIKVARPKVTPPPPPKQYWPEEARMRSEEEFRHKYMCEPIRERTDQEIIRGGGFGVVVGIPVVTSEFKKPNALVRARWLLWRTWRRLRAFLNGDQLVECRSCGVPFPLKDDTIPVPVGVPGMADLLCKSCQRIERPDARDWSERGEAPPPWH